MENINGSVERITYRDDESGFTVLKLRVKGFNELIAVTGNMTAVNIGSVLSLRGKWKTDNKYGRQFEAKEYTETLPANVYGLQKYLASLVHGVGPKHAKKIVDTFQEDTLNILDNDPDKLNMVEGLGKKRAEAIKSAWLEQKDIKNLMIFLQEKGISTAYAPKIYKVYGNKSIETITENPYKLIDDVDYIGFKTADLIAQKLGIDKERYMRCRAGVFYVLSELANEGHCFAFFDQLIKISVELLDIEEPKMVMTLSYLIVNQELTGEENKSRVYSPLT